MKAIIHLNAAELGEAIIEYLDNSAASLTIGASDDVKIEFTYTHLNGNSTVDGARVVFNEKLTREDS